MKQRIIKYSITTAVGLLLSFAVCAMTGIFSKTLPDEIFKSLSDGFFVSGVLLLGWGLLVVASNGGTFDIFGFAGKSFISLFQSKEKRKLNKSFYEYRKAKQEKKRSFLYLVIVGAALILIGVIFTIVFYNV